MITCRRGCFFVTLGLTCLFVAAVSRLQVDNRLVALIDVQASSYQHYQIYLERFSSGHVLIVAVTLARGADNPRVLNGLVRADAALHQLPEVQETTSLLDVAALRKTGKGITKRPLFSPEHNDGTEPSLDRQLLTLLRKTYPAIQQLISQDERTLGILVKLRPLAPQQKTGESLRRIEGVILQAFGPEATALHMSGEPILMEAVKRYNVDNALIFLFCACVVGVLIEFYIFKNFIISLIIYCISAAATAWGMGLMALMGVSLNPISGMAFGMILILTTMTVIHVVTHYYGHYLKLRRREDALRAAVASVGRPGLMCAVTTAIGFASIVTCSVPAVRQFGLIMAVGAVLSFGLVYLLLPYILLHLQWTIPRRISARSGDLLQRTYEALGRSVMNHSGRYVLVGTLLLAVLLLGVQKIRVNTRLMNLFHQSAPEVVDYQYIQKKLAPPHALHVLIEAHPHRPLNAQSFLAIKEFENKLLGLNEVQESHSFFRVLETVYASLFNADNPSALYKSAFLLQQAYRRCISNPESKQLFAGVLDLESRSFCLSLQIRKPYQQELEKLVAKIDLLAKKQLPDMSRIWVTGAEVATHSQSERLIRAQAYSLSIALVAISLLLMLQFGSWQLGAVSLIPNVFSLAAIFGVMGWFGIPLDNITIMVAVISFGLSVDDTIHYLSQLRNALVDRPMLEAAPAAVDRAYRVSAKALISTSAVMVFSFITLVFSPFRPTTSFGLLASVAALTALAADLLFMPALILKLRVLQKLTIRGLSTRQKT